MNLNRVLVWILKILFISLCLSQLALYTKLTIDDYKHHKSDPIGKRIFVLNKTIYLTLLLSCLIAALFNGSFFLQSATIGLAFIWLDRHYQNAGILWTGTVEQITSYVLLLSVIIVGQLLAFTLSSKRKTEFIPYYPTAKANNDFSFKRKVSRTGSTGSYTRNLNLNGNSDILRNNM